MGSTNAKTAGRTGTIQRWVRIGFIAWAILSTTWLLNSFRTRDVPPQMLSDTSEVLVLDTRQSLTFIPTTPRASGLVFICGAGPAAEAYAPLLRPLAEEGFPVIVIRLPLRIAPLETHKSEVLDRVHKSMAAYPVVQRWVLAGHSLGGKLASRFALTHGNSLAALVLVGTTHPRDFDLSSLTLAVSKVYGDRDGIAPIGKVNANAKLLPTQTEWVLVTGGNHSQFGHYGAQLQDKSATISRGEQQAITRKTIRARLLQETD